MAKIENPKVFISYCWSNDDYINKVVDFAKRLRSNGVNVVLDQFHMKLGNDMNNFMEKCVNDPTITNVLILLSPDYKTKADTRSGGAGIETQIISGEVYANVGNTKFIPILFEKRGEDTAACIPTYLKQRRWLDMSEDSDYESQYIELVRTLFGNDKFVENPLGSKPEWVEENNNSIANIQIIVNSFKAIKKEYGNERAIASSFDSIKSLLISAKENFKNNQSVKYDDFAKYYSRFIDIREPYLSFINEIKYDKNIGESLYNFFSEYNKMICESRTEFYFYVVLSRVFIHEIYIETIALLLKSRNYLAINYLTTTPYIDYYSIERKLSSFFDVFYSCTKENVYAIDEFLGRQLQKDPTRGNYFSGIAELWMRNMPIRYISESDFANADCLLTNISTTTNDDYSFWFALTYIYLPNRNSELIREISIALTSKKLAKKYYILFDCDNINLMRKKYNLIKRYTEKREYRLSYSGAFYSIPLLSNYIKEEEIESRD